MKKKYLKIARVVLPIILIIIFGISYPTSEDNNSISSDNTNSNQTTTTQKETASNYSTIDDIVNQLILKNENINIKYSYLEPTESDGKITAHVITDRDDNSVAVTMFFDLNQNLTSFFIIYNEDEVSYNDVKNIIKSSYLGFSETDLNRLMKIVKMKSYSDKEKIGNYVISKIGSTQIHFNVES